MHKCGRISKDSDVLKLSNKGRWRILLTHDGPHDVCVVGFSN